TRPEHAAPTAAGASSAFAQRAVQVRTRRLDRRHDPEHHAWDDRDREGEGQHTPVEMHERAVIAQPWKASRIDREQPANSENTEDDPERAAHDAEQNALREKLPDDPRHAS